MPLHSRIATELLNGRSGVGYPRVNPDGAHVACVVSTIDLDENTTRSRVWLDGLPVTAGPFDSQPTWSPDGRWLAFTSRRGEKKGDSTLHLLPVSGPGEVRTICTMPDGLDNVAWSPNGNWIGFTSRTRDARYDAKDVSWQAPRKVDRFFSRLNGEDWIFDRPQHVYVVRADGTGKPRNLTPGEFQHGTLAWFGDSSGLVVEAQRHADFDRDLAHDLYLVPLDGEITALTHQTGLYDNPSVSPDGTMIAFTGFDDAGVYPQNVSVGVMAVDGSDRRWISQDLDRTFMPTSGVRSPVWLDDERLLATAEDRGDTHVYELHVDGRAPKSVTDGRLVVTDFDAAGGVI